MRTKQHAPYFATEVTADVEIDPDDLREAGWHHESECNPDNGAPVPPPVLDLGAAVASLHRQAHPREIRSVTLCREEPCRSLTLDQLRQVTP